LYASIHDAKTAEQHAVIKITIISFYFCSAEWSLNTEWSLNRPALLSSISIV
jgi:hypothetical protein